MKQGQYSPLSVAQMAVSLFAANEGFLDDIEVNKVSDFEYGLQGYMKAEHGELLDKINETGDYSDEIQKSLSEAVTKYKATHTW
jgi:F-type H+-transporting ATPase subunit alpha